MILRPDFHISYNEKKLCVFRTYFLLPQKVIYMCDGFK